MVVRLFLPGFVELFVRFGLGIGSLSRRPEIEILPGFSVPNRRGVKERIHWKAGIDIHGSPCPFLVNASSVKLLPSTVLIDYSAGSRQNLIRCGEKYQSLPPLPPPSKELSPSPSPPFLCSARRQVPQKGGDENEEVPSPSRCRRAASSAYKGDSKMMIEKPRRVNDHVLSTQFPEKQKMICPAFP